jgi:predicted phosphodiesterase
MRILVLSDIHANHTALEKILTHAPAYEAVWCLGDVVGYGPAPNECIARLRGLDALTLLGNHDLGALGRLPPEQFSEGARNALAWTKRVLTAESRAWLEGKATKQVLKNYDLTLVHASPSDPVWDYIENEDDALENFPYFETSYCFYGHTHRPISFRLNEKERILRVEPLVERQPYVLQRKLLLNVGSAGQPRDGDSRAAFGIYDTDANVLTPYRIEYEVAAVQRAMRNAGLPTRLIERLAHGV